MLGTLVDSYFRGYDVVLIKDATATTSPEGALENVYWNAGNVCKTFLVWKMILISINLFCMNQSYGFLTDSKWIAEGVSQQ